MKFLILIIFMLSLLSVVDSNAQLVNEAWKTASHKHLNWSNNQKLPYIFLKGRSKNPVVLLHGYGGSVHNWMDIAEKLNNKGHPVWIFSWLKLKGSLDHHVTETIPQVIDRVYRHSRKKIWLIGHSLGGMGSKLSVYGVRCHQSCLIDSSTYLWTKTRVAKVISLASPNGGEIGKVTLMDRIRTQFLADVLPSLVTLKPYDLSQLIREGRLDHYLQLDPYLVTAKTYEYQVRAPWYHSLYLPFVNLKNMRIESLDFTRMSLFGLSTIPTAVVRQVQQWEKSGLAQSVDKKLNYKDVFFQAFSPVPVFLVAGKKDRVAPAGPIVDEAKSRNVDILLLKEASHMDIVTGKTLDKLINFITQ